MTGCSFGAGPNRAPRRAPPTAPPLSAARKETVVVGTSAPRLYFVLPYHGLRHMLRAVPGIQRCKHAPHALLHSCQGSRLVHGAMDRLHWLAVSPVVHFKVKLSIAANCGPRLWEVQVRVQEFEVSVRPQNGRCNKGYNDCKPVSSYN